MNHPFSYPGTWWRTWTGLTYKISQASWNPENLGQSTVQIFRVIRVWLPEMDRVARVRGDRRRS
jgi:hypothetical protein